MRHTWRCEGHHHCGEDLSEPTHKGSRIVKYHKSCMRVVAGYQEYGDKCFLHGGLKRDRDARRLANQGVPNLAAHLASAFTDPDSAK